VNNEHDTPEALAAARMASEFRKALITALKGMSWLEVLAIILDLAREQEHLFMEALLEAALNMLNEFYGQGDLS
jgi:hypothetical protein